MARIAVDIDLHRIHAYCEERGRICYKSPDLQPIHEAVRSGDFLLVEIAGVNFYTSGKPLTPAVVSNYLKWTVFNVRMATELGRYPDTLVAPSSAWSRGYPEKVRHAMAQVKGDNHDIRECRAMLWFHTAYPQAWVPFDQFISKL